MDKFPIGVIMNKGLTVRTAQQHGQKYLPRLLETGTCGRCSCPPDLPPWQAALPPARGPHERPYLGACARPHADQYGSVRSALAGPGSLRPPASRTPSGGFSCQIRPSPPSRTDRSSSRSRSRSSTVPPARNSRSPASPLPSAAAASPATSRSATGCTARSASTAPARGRTPEHVVSPHCTPPFSFGGEHPSSATSTPLTPEARRATRAA